MGAGASSAKGSNKEKIKAVGSLPGSRRVSDPSAQVSQDEACICRARAMYDLIPEDADDLELREGDAILVDEIPPEGEQGSDWWRGRILREDSYVGGNFPCTYVTVVDDGYDDGLRPATTARLGTTNGSNWNENSGDSTSEADEFDDLVSRINTSGPQPYRPVASTVNFSDDVRIEDPMRGLQKCATLRLFEGQCSNGTLGRVVTVNAKLKDELDEKYFGVDALARQKANQDARNKILNEARLHLKPFNESRDPNAIAAALWKYDVLGAAIAEQRESLERRMLKLVKRAKAKMTECLIERTEPARCMKCMHKYGKWKQVSLEAKVIVKYLEIGVDAGHQLLDVADLPEIASILERYACTTEFTEISFNGLVHHREHLVETGRKRMLEAQSWSDPREVDHLLSVTASCTPEEVGSERVKLTAHLRKLCTEIIAELDILIQASKEENPFVAIEAALLMYQGYPDLVKPTWKLLRQRRDALLAEGKHALLDLANIFDLDVMNEMLAYYESYAESLHDERVLAETHREECLRQAKLEMAAAAVATGEPIEKLAMLLERFQMYPNCKVEWEQCRKGNVGMRLLEAIKTEDVVQASDSVEDFEHVEPFLPEEFAALMAHYEDLAAPMMAKMREVLVGRVPAEAEAVLKESVRHGRAVAIERKALEVFLQAEVNAAVRPRTLAYTVHADSVRHTLVVFCVRPARTYRLQHI